jgi:hypothetical protein
MEQSKDKTYKGVRKRKMFGRYTFQATVCFDKKREYLGCYKDAREAAVARDLYIIKKNIPVETQILKKKVA